LGDMPWIQPATCRALSAHASPAHIVRPRHAGRTGHPVLFGRDFWPMLAQLRGDRGASDVVRDNASACRVIEVGDPGTLHDVDTPEALAPPTWLGSP
ncbi:MAG: NTP transferase domain-containing protein, partial [Halomonas sp.]|nr:NTP transferase domain-containing protein [Halomonas sp.]